MHDLRSQKVTNKVLTLLIGDVMQQLAAIPDGSVQCCVTSPPYWGLRDYGTAAWQGGDDGCDHMMSPVPLTADSPGRRCSTINDTRGTGTMAAAAARSYRDTCGKCGAVRIDNQIGLEKTPDEYVQKMVAVFREVRRVLRDDGLLFVNLGDSYATGTTADRQASTGVLAYHTAQDIKRIGTPKGLKTKDLCGIPWRVAFALQADGWWLRSDIIWAKPNPMPESVTDRPTKSHEYIFMLAKQERYYFDADAVREPSITHDPRRPYTSQGAWQMDGRPVEQRHGGKVRSPAGWKTGNGSHGSIHENGREQEVKYVDDVFANRNIRTVWQIATQPFPEAHFATFPEELAKRCILAGTKPGDTVLDPFAGSGTTLKVALELGRRAIGIELNPDYAAMINRRCQTTIGLPL